MLTLSSKRINIELDIDGIHGGDQDLGESLEKLGSPLRTANLSPLAVCGCRQEETVHRSSVSHEWRMARWPSVSPRSADGFRPREQPERHSAGLRAGTHSLR